jgi:hypothetical protein
MNQFSTEIYDKKIQLVTKGLLTNAWTEGLYISGGLSTESVNESI